ncbi:MAG: hypothetical protein H0U10_02565 [Chloroflexia bacterium]|nr:hypothetical protein [Chloroflexia bacterium]
MGAVGGIRSAAAAIAITCAILVGGPVAAQQDVDGDGLYEICVFAWGHMGQESYEPAEVTLDELEQIAVDFHANAFQANADGTCPPREQATSLEVTYCVWDLYEVWDENGVAFEYRWGLQWHSLPYYEQHLLANGANIAPSDGYVCPVDPPVGFVQ